jgi:hypothetical protein
MQIDRAECMLILENKANHTQLVKINDDLLLKIENNERVAAAKLADQ